MNEEEADGKPAGGHGGLSSSEKKARFDLPNASHSNALRCAARLPMSEAHAQLDFTSHHLPT